MDEPQELFYPRDHPARGRLKFLNWPDAAQGSCPFLVTRVRPPCLAVPRLVSIQRGSIRLASADLRSRRELHLVALLRAPSTAALLLLHLGFQDWKALVAANGDTHVELQDA